MKAALLVLALTVLPACRQPDPHAATYAAQLLACVELAHTRDEADACTDSVKRAYGRLDAGVSDAK